MNPILHRHLVMTSLENRETPAINLFYAGGNLNITGTPDGVLTLKHAGSGISVLDGTVDYGKYAVTGNVRLNLYSYSNNIDVNLNGNTLPGNLFINHQIGVLNTSETNIFKGGIAGSIVYNGGLGREYLDIENVTVGGDVRFNGRVGAAADSYGNNLDLEGVTVGRHVIGSSAHFLQTFDGANPTQIGGNLISTTPSATRQINLTIGENSSIAGNVVVTGTAVSDGLGTGDVIVLETNAVIAGNLTASLGDNLNLVLLQGTVNGNATIIGGSGSSKGIAVNELDVSGTINGNLNVVFGNAVDTTGGDGNLFTFELGTVNGNVNLNFGGGSGNNLNGISNSGFKGTVNGDIFVRLGNAPNQMTINGKINSGRVDYVGGSKTDLLVIDGAYTFALTANLGAGADTFGLVFGSAVLGSMAIDFGVDFDNDEFNDDFNASGSPTVLTWPTVLLNLT